MSTIESIGLTWVWNEDIQTWTLDDHSDTDSSVYLTPPDSPTQLTSELEDRTSLTREASPVSDMDQDSDEEIFVPSPTPTLVELDDEEIGDEPFGIFIPTYTFVGVSQERQEVDYSTFDPLEYIRELRDREPEPGEITHQLSLGARRRFTGRCYGRPHFWSERHRTHYYYPHDRPDPPAGHSILEPCRDEMCRNAYYYHPDWEYVYDIPDFENIRYTLRLIIGYPELSF